MNEEERIRRLLDALLRDRIERFDFEALWNTPLPRPRVLLVDANRDYVLLPVRRRVCYDPNPGPPEYVPIETVEVRRASCFAHSVIVSVSGKREAVTFPPRRWA